MEFFEQKTERGLYSNHFREGFLLMAVKSRKQSLWAENRLDFTLNNAYGLVLFLK